MTLYCSQRTCAHCGQGKLSVFKNTSTGQLYLHCTECEHGWDDAAQWYDRASAFPTPSASFEPVPASWCDIEDQGWQRFASQVLQE